MHDNVISLVKSLSIGPCSCYYTNGSFSVGYYDGVTGLHVPGKYDPGPKTECMRCRARGCLETDGIEYEKDDRAFYTMHNGLAAGTAAPAAGLMISGDGATACKTMPGVTVITGSLSFHASAGVGNQPMHLFGDGVRITRE